MHSDESDDGCERQWVRLGDVVGIAGLLRRIQEINPEGVHPFVVLIGNPDANYYIQFSADSEHVRTEAVSNEFLEPEYELDEDQIAQMHGLGWLPPEKYLNYYREWTLVTNRDRHTIARHAIRTFQEVYGVDSAEK